MNYLLNFSLIFRNRNFGLLFLGQFVSFFGTMITSVALPYQIYHETHSTLMVGLVSLFQLLPLLVTAMIGGVFADRYHRRQLLIIAECLLSLCSLLLALNANLHHPQVWFIFVVATFASAVTGLHRPALESISQQIIDKKDFGAVGALRTFMYSGGMIIGPAMGGLLIAHFGLVVTYLVDFFGFAVSLVALYCISGVPKPQGKTDESTWKSIVVGIRYAASRQELLGTYFVDFAAMIFGMPTALFPAIAQWYGGPKALGMLYAAPAVGAMFFSFYGGWNRIKRQGVAIGVSATLWGVAIIFFGLSHQFFAALFFLALAGGFDAVSGIFRMMMWNETIPTELRGRLAGIEMISYLSGPRLGDTEAGLVAAAFGITTSIISGGVLCVVGVVACCYFLPKFWRYESEQAVSS